MSLDTSVVAVFATEREAISELRKATDECAASAPKPPKANADFLTGKKLLAKKLGPKNAHDYMSAMLGDLRSYTGGQPHRGVSLSAQRDGSGMLVVAQTMIAGHDWLFTRFYQTRR